MKKLTLTVSASLLAVAGCGSEPIHTNSGPAPDPPTVNSLPMPSDTATATIAPAAPSTPVLKTPAQLNALPTATAPTADPRPAPSTKPAPVPEPLIHTNTMPR